MWINNFSNRGKDAQGEEVIKPYTPTTLDSDVGHFELVIKVYSESIDFSLSFLFLLLHSLPPLTCGDNCFTLLLWVFLGICHEIAYGFLASCLASCPTWTSKFLIGNSVLLWLDMHTCLNLVNVSSSLVVVFYKLGPWLGGRLHGPPWSTHLSFKLYNLMKTLCCSC